MNNSTEACSSYQFSPSFLVLGTLSGISSVFSIVGNSVVLWTVYKTEALQSVSNFFIASLALADLLVGLVLNPILIVRAVVYGYQMYTNIIPHGFDVAEDYLWIQCLLISTFSFTTISIDRFIAITRAMYYETVMTTRRCQIIIVFLWTSSLSIALLRVFLRGKDLPWLWLATIILACLFPLCITCYCYTAIFRTARLQIRNIASLSNTQEQEQHSKAVKNTKAAFTIAIVIGVFAISYAPSVVVACVSLTIKGKCAHLYNETTEWPWACLVAYCSSAINPWIYSIRSQEFRQAIKRAFLRPVADDRKRTSLKMPKRPVNENSTQKMS
ncbi:octopamine receptor Oamb-like [Actinia tenebrosa]|uniref:Octopamine receptor Oamb-like n=1 Tax=Actinia tenebrosa TaxID=6105 RepID=A0A6P8IW24_ACTTE|nr:octopamine receptor Oamb-like [Actinia tenebrosa]